jgi:hypothetical protein
MGGADARQHPRGAGGCQLGATWVSRRYARGGGSPEDAETAGPANKIAAAERAVTGQLLVLSRIRPVRVLVRNLLSSCSHGAESMEAAWGGRRLERKLIARDDGHPMARDGPEAKAVRVGQCYQMERVLSCLDLGTVASEDLCSEGGHSSGRLSEAL